MPFDRYPKINSLDLRSKKSSEEGAPFQFSPNPRASFSATYTGRHVRRSGASIQGTLSNWVSHVVHSRIAEREKRKVADRSLDLYTNDAMSHGIMEGLPVEIVGTGLTPQQIPMLEWLELKTEWSEEYQRRTSGLFEIWGLDPRNFCDAQGRMNIYMLQAVALFMWKLEGVGLFQVLRSPRPAPHSPLNLRVLPIDPSRLITPSDKMNENIFDGLELGENGDMTYAWILKGNRLSQYTSARSGDCNRVPVYDEETGLPNLLIVCDVRNISEYRQDSIFGPMIKEIRDNNDFVDAALVKALIANLFTVFVENSLGSSRAPADWADRIYELEKGTILQGALEEKPHIIQGNDTPGPSYDIMNNSIIGRLGMATGRGPENISRAYKASYSASQASIENAGKFDDVDRMVLTNRFCQPLHAWMQYEGVLRGILPVDSVKRFLENLHAYTRTDWLPPKLRPIDKLKAAKSDDVRLGNGTRTYSDVYGEQSRDYRMGLRQWVSEIALLRELATEYGLTLEEVLSVRTKNFNVPQPDEPETED